MKLKSTVEFFANVEKEKSFKLLLKKWNSLCEMKEILHLPYLCTVELQNADFTLTDFYGWLKIMDMKLKKIISDPSKNRTRLATKLLHCLDERKDQLIENPFMQCAIFLDPRFKRDIDGNTVKVQMVKTLLQDIWDLNQSIKQKNIETSPVTDERPSNSSDKMEDLYAELDELQMGEVGTDDRNEIAVAVDTYEAIAAGLRMKSNESIQSFWDSNKTEIGAQLYEIACIIFAIPPTQASVERSFSALKFLFSDYRYGLSEQRLEDLMIVHLNKDLFYLVRDEDLNQCQESFQEN